MSVATRPDRHDAARRFRRRTATAAAAWSIAVTLVALVIVGVAVFGGGRPTIEAGLGSGAAGDSPLRDRIATELGPLLAEPLSGIWAAYRDRAVLWGALALVVVGAASAAIGWWFADDCSAIPPPSVALGASSPRERPPRSRASSSRCPPAGRADRDGSDRAADCHGGAARDPRTITSRARS
ncbi:MAG TPA: hypothetical protein VFH30_20495 [Acidimicrobiales bacterium]|nr:hypothetical protein [Acidimicrobiales bacterium]